MVVDWEEYDEELDRTIEYWQRSEEYAGGGRAELVRFFSKKTVDDYFESVKEELAGREIMGRSASETRASMHEYMTRDVHSDKVYKARAEWAGMMFRRAHDRQVAEESWKTVREYIKEPSKKPDTQERIDDILKELDDVGKERKRK